MSAPDSCVVVARSASAAAAASQVGPIDRDPPATGADQRPGFLGQAGDVGRGQLHVVEDRRPPHVGELGRADRRSTTPRRTPAASASRGAAPAPGCARRTRRPRAATPVFAIRSHASSWLRITWPRRVCPGAAARGASVRGRASWSSRSARPDPALTIACSIGTQRVLARRARTPRDATRRRGREDRAGRSARACSRVTERAQSAMRVDEVAGDPHRGVERAAVEPGQERLGDVVRGPDARRRRGHLDPPRAVPADRVDHARTARSGSAPARRRSCRARARCPAASSAISLRRRASTSAGVHRTANDELARLSVPLRRRRWRSSGTIAPRAVSSTAQTATRPNHRTLGADVVADLAGSDRDQPAEDVADRGGERVGRDPTRAAEPRRAGSNLRRRAHRRRRASP